MKILLVGNGPITNRGCEAIAKTTIKLLKKFVNPAEISYLSFYPELDIELESEGVNVGPLKAMSNLRYHMGYRIMNKLKVLPISLKASIKHLSPYYNHLQDTSVVLSLGGDNYTDDYGIPYLFWSLAYFSFHKKVPFIIWGASVGKFKSAESIELAKKRLKCVYEVTAREDLTADYLKDLGYKGKVTRVFDTAFLLNPEATAIPEYKNNRKLLGLNISPLFSKYTPFSKEDILKIFAKFISYISNEYNVLLIPHVFIDTPVNDDYGYMKDLLSLGSHVQIVDSSNNCSQLKYLISKCDAFIGARTHSTIAAFSSSVPTLSLGYSTKAKGINQDLFGHLDYLVDSREFNRKILDDKFKLLQTHSEQIQNILKSNQEEYKRKAFAGINSIVNITKNTKGLQ